MRVAVLVRFQTVVVVGKREPIPVEDVSQEVLVWKQVRLGFVAIFQGREDCIERLYGGFDNQ